MAKLECRPLVEPVAITDVYCSGIAKIEALGPCARFTLYVDSTVPEADDAPCRSVAIKIVIPVEALPAAIRQAVSFLADQMMSSVTNGDNPPSAFLH